MRDKVLAVGSGSIMVSLVASLFNCGLSKVHVLFTEDSSTADRQQVDELAAHACQTDPAAVLEEIRLPRGETDAFKSAVRLFDSVLYASQADGIDELRTLHSICLEEKKVLIPAVCVGKVGVAGPLVHPNAEGCWESAWRRIHRPVLEKNAELPAFSSAGYALLTNVIVFEWLKTMTGSTEPEAKNKVYLLDLETLEGDWHVFMPHPLVTGRAAAEWAHDFDLRLEQSERTELDGLLSYFHRLTSEKSGIFHTWEEGSLTQLPLSQCRVHVVDPLSEGPAELLPSIVCAELTHEKARREAGLAGIEAYVSRMADLLAAELPDHPELEEGMVQPQDFIGVGAGQTFAEGIYRGLRHCLNEEVRNRLIGRSPSIRKADWNSIEDEVCRYYLQALTTLQGEPMIGMGEEAFDFPVVWVGSGGRWFGCADLNMTMTLRRALQQTLLHAQNQGSDFIAPCLTASSVIWNEAAPLSLEIPSVEKTVPSELLRSARSILERNRKRIIALDLELEPFLKEGAVKVVGVLLREVSSQ